MLSTRRIKLATHLTRLHTKSARKGFTLIELLVVVVIIGILASVALPSFVGAQDKARNSAVQGNLNTVKMALEQFSTDNNGSYPTTTTFAQTTNGGLMVNNYLPGNKLPKSPWGTTNQAACIGVASPEVTAQNVNSGSSLPTLGTTLSSSGSVAGQPTSAANYGAFEYDYDSASQIYTLYGTGKKGSTATVGAETSNGGQ